MTIESMGVKLEYVGSDELLELRRAVAGLEDEFAVMWTEISSGTSMESEDALFWGPEDEAREVLDSYNEATVDLEATGGKVYFTGEIVKRRKAGKPGKVEKA